MDQTMRTNSSCTQPRTRPLSLAVRDIARKGAVAALLAATALPLATVAQAQGGGAQPGDQGQRVSRAALEEVMVTARRREESAQMVPVAINAIDASTLEDFRIQDLEDLQQLVPALSVSSASGRPNAPIYSLRGVRPTELVFGQDPTVAVYLADVVLAPNKGTNLGMYDLSSVQVLKGPQGTLFGRNTTGGAILLSPTRPGAEFGGDLMVGVGRYGRQESQVGVDVPVADNFAVRFSGRTVDSDGYQTNVVDGSKLGGEKTRSARLSAVWDISPTVENHTILTWDDRETDGPAAKLVAVNTTTGNVRFYNGGAPFNLPSIQEAFERGQTRGVHDIESDMRQRSQVEAIGIINTTTIELSDTMTLKSIAGYRDVDAFETVDLDATSIAGVLSTEQTTSMEHASYELQLLGSALEDRLDWVTGLYWFYEDGVEDSPGDTLLGINPTPWFVQNAQMTNNSYSVFAQGTYHINDAWSVTGGARWTYDDKELEVSTYTAAYNGGPMLSCQIEDASGNTQPFNACSAKMTESFDQPTGTLSLEYTPTENTLLYAATRYGYRAGGFNARAANITQQKPFDPETVVDIELGVKTDWFVGDWQMRTNVSLYHQWYDDIQRTVAVSHGSGTPTSVIENAAKATVAGLEIEQTISPTDNLTFTLQYAYTDPEYDEWIDPASGADLSSTPFAFTAEHAATIGAAYSYPLGGNAGQLEFSVMAAYKDDVWINPLQTSVNIAQHPESVRHALQQEAYWLVDLSTTWRNVMGTPLEISAYAKNLTDKEYSVGGMQLYHSIGLSTKVYGEPRTFGMQVRYSF